MDLYMNPRSIEAADFIGNPRINFVQAKANWDGGSLTISSELGEYSFPKEQMLEIPEKRGGFDCVMGVRPEQVQICLEDVPDSIDASVYASQPAGSETLITIRLKDQRILVKEIGIVNYMINQPVRVLVNPAKVNVYRASDTCLIKEASV